MTFKTKCAFLLLQLVSSKLLPLCMPDVWPLCMYQSLHVLQLVQRHSRIPAACQHSICHAGVVFVPAKTPVKLEATDDGLDVWIAAVNPQAFQGEFCHLRSPSKNVIGPAWRFEERDEALIAGALLFVSYACRTANDGCRGIKLQRARTHLDWCCALFWLCCELNRAIIKPCRE